MIRQGHNHYDSRKIRKYLTKTDLLILKYIEIQSRLDFTILLINFKHESYVWRFYPILKRNPKITALSLELESKKINNGLPENIIYIVYLVNRMTCFIARVKFYFYVVHWSDKIFLYYNRYYRYLANEKEFGKRKIIPKKYSHKVHFIPYLYRREITGMRIEKNHLRY